jgi:hypothetical protein
VAPGLEATIKEIMEHRLRTKEGKALYDLRKETVEPIFGIIKETMGFRRFSMRGKAKAALEWTLVTLSYNLRRLYCVHMGRQNAGLAGKISQGEGQKILERVQVWIFSVGVIGSTQRQRVGHLLLRFSNALRAWPVLYLPYPPLRRIFGERDLSPTGC